LIGKILKENSQSTLMTLENFEIEVKIDANFKSSYTIRLFNSLIAPKDSTVIT
jgi:hypothetical protein